MDMQRNSWIVSFSILVFSFLFSPFLPFQPLDKPLLRALFQGMVTLFGLAFTISLVMAQLLARYSYRSLRLTFFPRLVPYGSLFATAIVLPLIFHLVPPSPWNKTCIILDLLAFFMLFPYFCVVLDSLRPSSLVKSLGEQAKRKLRYLRQERKIEEIQALDDIATNALGFRDYDAFSLALGELRALYFLGSEEVWQNFSELCSKALLEDHRAIRLSVRAMRDFAKEAIEKKRKDSVKLVLKKLEEEFFEAARTENVSTAIWLASAACEIGLDFVKQVLDEALRDILSRVILTLELICHHAAEHEMWEPAVESAGALLDIGTHFFEKDEFVTGISAQALQRVKKKPFGKEIVIDAVKIRLGREDKDKIKRFLKSYLTDIYQHFWR